jgi:anti-sigma-K factor RskA
MSTADHRQWEDDLAAYVLGALDVGERQAFEEHLAGCDRCRIEVRWLEPAVDALPASVDQSEPPPALRGRILDAIAPEAERSGERRRSSDRPRWRLGGMRPALAATAAAAALVAGVAGGYALRGDDEPSSLTVPVQAAAPAQRASASVVREGDEWRLDVSDMPALRAGDVYQVWMRDGQRVIPSVQFVLSDGEARVSLPQRMDAAEELMVTREPRGGSRAPTSAPMLSVAL